MGAMDPMRQGTEARNLHRKPRECKRTTAQSSRQDTHGIDDTFVVQNHLKCTRGGRSLELVGVGELHLDFGASQSLQ